MTYNPIYLDGFSTMPLAPEARAAMLSAWSAPGNAGSPHIAGERAAATIEQARASVARLIGAAPSEIVFTSGATEANNLAIGGIARLAVETGNKRRRIVVSAVEHKAVLEPARALLDKGFDVVVAPVSRTGLVDLTALAALVDDNTLLVSVMMANNETGTLQPIEDVVAIGRAVGALIHTDAAQAVGKTSVDVVDLNVDYLSISAHKFYGPVGVGALYVAAAAPTPLPIQFGGGQQGGVRPGTEPVPLLAGLGAAAQVAAGRIEEDAMHGRRLADRLRSRLAERQVSFVSTTGETSVLPGSLSLVMNGVEADDIVLALGRTVCLSTGSACASGQILPSHVLLAMGFDHRESKSVIRIFCNRYNSDAEIDLAASLIADALLQARHRTGRSHQ
ncbi:cysteine desulfurase family protein [Mesorhizobium sp. M1396]|uniref:cysteine desulfurase family protein n=1 Tax=Mesorhizobium sp. M1396 TaxID=2957095 RepID=UPI00333A2FD0